nr:hypothetical protein [Halogeometricum sp. CBA1124]
MNVADTTCGYCAVGCRFDLYSDGEEILAARPTEDEDAPVNGISTCVKGKFGYDFVNSDDRLTTPLVRDENDEFREASWEEAWTASRRDSAGFATNTAAMRCRSSPPRRRRTRRTT